MGLFNALIDKGNSVPKVGMEYIYLLDMMWLINKPFEAIKVEENRIVTNVIRLKNGSYAFTDKETNIRYTSTYGWAFCENTPENIIKLEKLNIKQTELDILNKEMDLLRKDLNRLYNN